LLSNHISQLANQGNKRANQVLSTLARHDGDAMENAPQCFIWGKIPEGFPTL
jgi:DNA-binding transcriptional MocR family regulator